MSTPSAPAAEETPSAADRERDIAARQHPNQPAPSQLYFAIADGRIEEVERELAANGVRSSDLDTTLHVCAGDGFAAAVDLLLAAGADPKLTRRSGQSALHVACEAGHWEIAEKLVKAGCPANVPAVEGDVSTLPLYYAVSQGNQQAVHFILANGPHDVNAQREPDGDTVLMAAARAGSAPIVRLLLDNGADQNIEDATGRTALYHAADSGCKEAIDCLIDASKAGSSSGCSSIASYFLGTTTEVDKTCQDGSTPLHAACAKGHSSVVVLLLDRGAVINSQKSNGARGASSVAALSRGTTPLMLACQKGNTPLSELLIARGADVNLGRHGGDTPLYCACDVGSTALVQLLLSKGARVDEAYYDGATALMKVCDRGLLEAAMLLVDKGADVNRATSDGTTPLYSAIQKGFLPLVKLLLKMGANAKFCRPADGASTLHCACEYNADSGILELLLESGVDPNCARADGLTPLVMSASRGRAEFCALLIKGGADVDLCKGRSGVTPIFAACEAKSVDTAALLLDNHANPNAARFDGDTPLMQAAAKGSAPLVALLLSRMADVNAFRPKDGASPLSVACEAGHRDVVELLLQQGADVFRARSHRGAWTSVGTFLLSTLTEVPPDSALPAIDTGGGGALGQLNNVVKAWGFTQVT